VVVSDQIEGRNGGMADRNRGCSDEQVGTEFCDITLDLLNMLLTCSSRLEMFEEARVVICLACLAVYFSLWHYDTLDCT
jgi:hypothetical protein